MQRKGWVACAWRNTAGIGEPPRFVVTDWRPATREDRKAKREEKAVDRPRISRGAVKVALTETAKQGQLL